MIPPLKIVCFTKTELIEAALTYEEDSEAKWFYAMEETPRITLCYEEGAWWFRQNRFHLSPQPVQWEHAYEIIWQDQPALLYITSPDQDSLVYAFYALPIEESVLIGRTQGDIRYDHVLISACHARLTHRDHEWIVEDLHSKNGVYVNHRRKKHHVLQMGDVVDIMGLQLLYGGSFIALNHTHTKVCSQLPPYQSVIEQAHPLASPSLPSLHGTRPYVPYEMPELMLEDPPMNEQSESMPLLYVLGPSLTMCCGSITASMFMLYGTMASGQPISATVPSLVMAATMLVSSLLWPILTRCYEQHKQAAAKQLRRQMYDAYLTKQGQILAQHMHEKQENLRLLNQSSDCLDALWRYDMPKRQLYVCLGIGDMPIAHPFRGNKTPFSAQNDALMKQRDAFLQAPCVLKQVPILIHTTSFRLFSCIGEDSDLDAYARYLLARHVLLYAPQKALVLLALSQRKMSFPRFLPQLFNENGYRYLCCDKTALHEVLMHLKQDRLPTLALSFEPEFTAFFERHGKEVNMVLFAFHPCDDTAAIIHVKKNAAQLGEQQFHWQREQHFEALMRILCNIPYERFQHTFPKQISFFAMHRYERITQFQIAKRWQDRSNEGSLCAALGVGEDGSILVLDLHERAHGPHGIVAGMTGSGKSELLITMLMSLACNYHPYDCAFILIDYKGGGMAKALQRLPHTAGIITNLDGSMIERSLDSLHAELVRRQRIFARVMDEHGLASMNIDIYQKLFHEQKVRDIIPHLIIAADEFAELKQQEPQFMEQLIRIARIGRSLGIHLILATQKPSGVVDDQIWSNARFHICLKVADKADSMDMLKREEGAQIRAVGRFYLQVGYDELFTQGQCAYIKAPYDPQGNGMGKVLLAKLEDNGSVRNEWKRRTHGTISEMDALIEQICTLGEAASLRTPRLWLAPLCEALRQEELSKGMIALADDPWEQSQFPLSVETQYHNTLLLAQEMQEAAQALMTWLIAYMEMNAHETHHVVIIDGGHGELCSLQTQPHLYAALAPEEEADIRFVMRHLIQVKKARESEHHWLLVIHNVAGFLEQVEEGAIWLRELVRDHGTSGILVWLSAMSVSDVSTRLYRHFENLVLFHMQDEQEAYALLGSHRRMGKARLRAMWKYLDRCYEIQIAQPKAANGKTKAKTGLKMPRLPMQLAYRELADRETDFIIGISLKTREVLRIAMQGIWIISGPRAREQLRLWKQLCEDYAYAMSFPKRLEECRDEGMEVLYVAPDQLSMLFHQPRFVSLREEGHVLWYGSGFADYRYLWNMSTSIACDKNEGIWLKEEVEIFLSVSAR